MTAVPQLVPGQVLARDFRVIAPLAHGGMGAVYVVEQLSTGKRRALKVMLPQLVADARARERFHQESRIGGQIDSEHIVEVLGAGIDEGSGVPWLAMELLEGRDLSSVREHGPLPHAEVHEILQQLGEGLGAAHAKGIVHRDLKPENLFVAISRRRGVPFTVKILDFGIAKLTQESRTTASATAAIGSPMWMAPEQTEQHARLRPATDVWAMGLIAFHLLTGRFYWRVANLPDLRLTALFTEVLVTPLEPASVRAQQLQVGHLIPPGFDGWFARCVDRDPEHRFPDARIAATALGPTLALREDAWRGAVPSTHEQPLVTASMVVPPTIAMEQAPPPPPSASWPPHGHAPAQPHLAAGAAPAIGVLRPAGSTTTPYAVHGVSTSTGALGVSTRGRATLVALGLLAGALTAGVLALGGLMLWRAPAAPSAEHDGSGRVGTASPQRSAADLAGADLPAAGLPSAGLGTGDTRVGSDVEVAVLPTGIDHPDRAPPANDGASEALEEAASSGHTETEARARAAGEPRFGGPGGATRRWRGSWSGQGWRYAIDVELAREGDRVTGTIGWRLLETPSPEFQPRIGQRAVERVAGTYREDDRTLELAGSSTSDPTLVQPDRYSLRISARGVLGGSSASDGGRVSARRIP
jgi:serine/threonine protein kinase